MLQNEIGYGEALRNTEMSHVIEAATNEWRLLPAGVSWNKQIAANVTI